MVFKIDDVVRIRMPGSVESDVEYRVAGYIIPVYLYGQMNPPPPDPDADILIVSQNGTEVTLPAKDLQLVRRAT